MKEKFWITGSQIVLLGLALMLASCAPTVTSAQTVPSTKAASAAPALAQPTPQAKNPGTAPDAGGAKMTMEQTLSDQEQLTTIAFDGLAFLTGNLGSDSFFPPGKVADYWGFQYLRDNDPSEMGHNTDFLTKASLNMLTVLTSAQRAQLATLAKSQVSSINEYGYKRFVMMKAFRRLLEGDIPAGTTGLDKTAAMKYSAELYRLDGQISYDRAKVMGSILKSLEGITQMAIMDLRPSALGGQCRFINCSCRTRLRRSFTGTIISLSSKTSTALCTKKCRNRARRVTTKPTAQKSTAI